MLNSSAYKARRTGTGAVSLRARGSGFLTLDHIRSEVPSIFAEEKHSSRSERYTYIPTNVILEGLVNEGFVVVEASQGGSRQEGKADFTKHSVRLRLADNAPALVGVTDQLYPEILLSNAHDGTGAYKLIPAAYRVLCANGLVSSSSLGEQKIPHKGDVMSEVIEGAFRVVNSLPKVIETAEEWGQIRLTYEQQQVFAHAAAATRWEPENREDPNAYAAPVPVSALNRTFRAGDQGPDLWRTYNRLQEGIIKGGQRYELEGANGKKTQRRVRPVTGIDDNRRVNQSLWMLAERMAELVK